jgi:hypothetical protein
MRPSEVRRLARSLKLDLTVHVSVGSSAGWLARMIDKGLVDADDIRALAAPSELDRDRGGLRQESPRRPSASAARNPDGQRRVA